MLRLQLLKQKEQQVVKEITMNKLKMESLDITKVNIDKIAEIFLQVVTEVADPNGAAYGCLLDWGVQLTMPHTTKQIEKSAVHTVDSPLTDKIDLIVCFDTNVSETVVRTIAKRKPTRALFRDSSLADSANKINIFEIFKSISPDTTVKVV